MSDRKTTLEKLIARRDLVDEMFLQYSDKERLNSNLAALGNLALIGGRLDTMIRRVGARERRQK